MSQAVSNPPADPVCLAISAATIKIPDPIIDPTTIIVPSNSPMARTNPPSLRATRDEVVDFNVGHIDHSSHHRISPLQQIHIFPRTFTHIFRAQDIADDRNRIRSRLEHLARSL